MGVLPLADPLSRPFAPAGAPAGDCLTVPEAVTAGLRCRFPALAAVTARDVAAHLTGGCGWPRRCWPSGGVVEDQGEREPLPGPDHGHAMADRRA